MSEGQIRVGIGGWTFAPWRGRFYPPGLRHEDELAYASENLSAIEINGTFYRHQAETSFLSWASKTPENFVFSVKAHRAATLGRDLREAGPAIARFLESGVLALGAKLGPVLWQLPPTKSFDAAQLEIFLALLPSELNGQTLRHAIEARHPSFLAEESLRLLRQYNVALVLVDSDKHPASGDITADFVYARLQRNDKHAPEGYDSAALDVWAARARGWAKGKPSQDFPLHAPPAPARPRDVFLFFIAGDKERAPEAARAMTDRLACRS